MKSKTISVRREKATVKDKRAVKTALLQYKAGKTVRFDPNLLDQLIRSLKDIKAGRFRRVA